MSAVIAASGIHKSYGTLEVLRGVGLSVERGECLCVVGPSGSGKSTLLRCLNLLEPIQAGSILFEGEDIAQAGRRAPDIRRRIGMVFQKPTSFPTMSVFDNVAAGLRLTRLWSRKWEMEEVVEKSLRRAALWDEVKDKLHQSGASLSGGQQQRLCIARAIAVEPEIILLDEPCSALDPSSTLKIEDLMRSLVAQYTIVIVTHNMQQAARVSDTACFFLADQDRAGILIEYGKTSQLFTNPKDKRTEDYITGRFG